MLDLYIIGIDIMLYFSNLLHSYTLYTQLLQSLMQLLVHQFLH
jgi:hypothetical protein